MANEWVKVELYGANNDGNPIRFTVPNNVDISQGTLMQLVDPFTASGAVTQGAAIAGVASMDKIANDGSTSISVWTDGRFLAVASAAITVGGEIAMGVLQNQVWAGVGGSGAFTCGHALETAATGDTFNVRLKL